MTLDCSQLLSVILVVIWHWLILNYYHLIFDFSQFCEAGGGQQNMHPATERWWLLWFNMEWDFCICLRLQHRLLQHSESNVFLSLWCPPATSHDDSSFPDSEDWLSMTAMWSCDMRNIHYIRSSDIRVLRTKLNVHRKFASIMLQMKSKQLCPVH